MTATLEAGMLRPSMPRRRPIGWNLLCACCLAVLALGCEDELPGTEPNDGARPGTRPPRDEVDLTGLDDIDIHFEVRAGGLPVGCDSEPFDVGRPSTAMTLEDARFYVSDVRLTTADGDEQKVVLKPDDEYQQAEVALLDFEDASVACELGTPGLHTVLHGAVKPGDYAGLAFVVGVPEALNHEDPTLAWPPLDVLPMHWGWTQGYRFLRLDFIDTKHVSFAMHIGSAACNKNARGEVQCKEQLRPEVELASFDPETQTVVLDLDVLFADWDVAQEAPDCIVGALPEPCLPMFESLGLDADTGAASPDQQTAFHAASR